MILTILLFGTGLALSTIATIYAVVGLMAIFPAAPMSIMALGIALELAKLVIASWLYRNWSRIPLIMKSLFSGAMIVLMLLTSMSIFGYLSKAHLEANVSSSISITQLEIINDKIITLEGNIVNDRLAIKQMDVLVNEMAARTDDMDGVAKSIWTRRSQKKERAILNGDIAEAQTSIAELKTDRAPMLLEVKKIEAEVGPLRYIAILIYGDNVTETILEKAVRGLSLSLVSVIDPLAILLLIAGNWNTLNSGVKREKQEKDYDPTLKDVSDPEDNLGRGEPALDIIDKDDEFVTTSSYIEPERNGTSIGLGSHINSTDVVDVRIHNPK